MRQIQWIFLAVILCLAAVYPAAASPKLPPRTIRVGCIDLNNFIEKKDTGKVSGYGVAYLDEIAKYTNWRYEYVFGNWSECLQLLKTGQIDLLLPAEYDTARAADYLFSQYSVCMDYAALLTKKDNNTLFYQDYPAFNALTIGLIRENYLNKKFMEFAQRHHFSPRYVYFDNLKELTQALESNAVDAIVNGNLNLAPQQKLLVKFDVMPAYFIMPKSHAALMDQLNAAMRQILLDNPYFAATLNENFYAATNHAKSFTREEIQYIRQNAPLTLICSTDHYPYEWYNAKTERFEGIYPEIIELLARQTGLTFNFLQANDLKDAQQHIQSGAADLLLNGFDCDASAQKYQMTYTEPYMFESQSLIGRRGEDFDDAHTYTVVLLRSDLSLRDYLQHDYPHWSLLLSDTEEECLRRVDRGEADLTLLDAARLQTYTQLNHYPSLGIIPTFSLEIPISLGMSNRQDPLLLSILNKSIRQITKKEREQIILKHTFIAPPKFTFHYLMEHYLPEILACGLFTILSLLAGLTFLYRERAKMKQNVLLAIKNNELKEVVMLAQHAGKAFDLYEGLYNTVPFGILQYELRSDTQQLTLLYANKGAYTILNLQPKLKTAFATMEDILATFHRLATSLQRPGDACKFEEKIHITDDPVWISGTAQLLLQEENKVIIQNTFMDTTQSKLFEQELQHRSETDVLTGLMNKATCETHCRNYIEKYGKQEPMALFIIDIDRFKTINDTCGHQYGDEILCKFAALLRQTFRKEDIVGRVGGDEFAILLKNTADRNLIANKAHTICQMTNALTASANLLRISCSIGIALQNASDAASYNELFAKADQALYQTKKNGRNGWTFFGD